MLHLLYALLATARSSLKPQRELALENLALRQQLAILRRKTKRLKVARRHARRARMEANRRELCRVCAPATQQSVSVINAVANAPP
jgi:Flp pilus assembly protein TadD